MKFRNKQREKEIDLNITPLVDVVFVLLIFFMVSTNFNKVTQLNLQLPRVTKDYNSEIAGKLDLKITSSGNYFINNLEVISNNKQTLMNAMSKVAGTNRELPLIIAGDKNAPHQAVVIALDAAGELGFKQIKIAAVKE
jgi:biopolymer transport protein ExbD